MPEGATESPTLELAEVDATFQRIAAVSPARDRPASGSGSSRELLARATTTSRTSSFGWSPASFARVRSKG